MVPDATGARIILSNRILNKVQSAACGGRKMEVQAN